MKVHIDIELDQSEVPLATELLSTLKLLTEHVKGSAVNVTVAGAPAGAAGALPAPPPAPQAPAAAAAVQPPSAAGLTRTQHAMQLTSMLLDPNNLAMVTKEIATLLTPPEGADEKESVTAAEEVVDGFCAAAFNPQLAAGGQSVMPFMAVFTTLPDTCRTRFKDKFIGRVLQQLTKKRPPPVPREDIQLPCEAFAVLVNMGVTSMDGALQTVAKVVKKENNRAAAILVLAHTLSRSPEKLPTCYAAHATNLLTTLSTFNDPLWAQEIAYIQATLTHHLPSMIQSAPPTANGGPAPTQQQPQQQQPAAAPQQAVPVPLAVPMPQPVPAAAAPPAPAPTPIPQGPAYSPASGPASTLVLTHSFNAGAGSIFALSYEPNSGCVVLAGKDLDMSVWKPDGTLASRISTLGTYVCGTDTCAQRGLLAWCGVADDLGQAASGNVKTRLALHSVHNNYACCATVSQPDADMYTCLRFLPEADGLVVGQTVNDAARGVKELVAYYDLNRLLQGANGASPPLATFGGHSQLVTCLAALPGRPHMFATGSRDETVQLWDVRQPGAASTLVVKHGQMVTGLDCVGNLLATCSLDQSVVAWDLRQVSSQPGVQTQPLSAAHWDNGGALKVAVAGSPSSSLAAVATVSGLVVVDFARPANTAGGGALVLHAVNGAGQALGTYNDIKWDSAKHVLYAAASDVARVDVLEARPVSA